MDIATILLVEDDQADAVLTLRALMRSNIEHQVYVVHDGVEALEYLFCTNKYADRDPQDLPQLTLLDIGLPKVNGLEVLRRLRAEQCTRQLPVVMLTSSDEEHDRIKSYENGANSYICKPTDFAQFIEAMQKVVLELTDTELSISRAKINSRVA